MTDACEHLEYREGDAEQEFDHARPYCTVVDEFVQPMRADVCARRYGLEPDDDCEYYREHHDLGSVTGFEADADGTGRPDVDLEGEP